MSGFTLIELLIVIAIIGILSSVGIYSFISTKEKNSLKNSQREVASAINLTKSYALQGLVVPGGSIAPCGYGFRFVNNNTYQIFYIKNSSSGVCASNCSSAGSNCVKLEEYALSNNVKLSGVYQNSEMYFSIPHGNVYKRDGSVFYGTDIVLVSASGSTSRSITVNRSGLVVEN